MEKSLLNRLLSLMLVAAMLCGFVIPVHAAEESDSVRFQQVDNSAVTAVLPGHAPITPQQEEAYAPTDEVRVSIVLEKKSTVAAGFELQNIAQNASAMAYRQELQDQQAQVTASIEKSLEQKLDVAWNLTLAANLISADVEYGQIEAIEKVPGVEKVLIETRYEPAVVDREETNDPNMATSSKQIGSSIAWDAGYTGAGARIAVIDTGIDTTHQSFDNAGYKHSLECLAKEKGIALDEYMKQLDLLDVEEIQSVQNQLHVQIDPKQAFVSEKLPFAYNYVDQNYTVDHLNDTQGEHGSHVSGIAAANAYIAEKDGTFSKALESAKVQGVAPDAQIITMKVFGAKGGAYDSDYMVAIEDAIILGCDTVNMSLGAGNPGNSRHANKEYQTIMDNLTKAGIVVCISAGNSGNWVQNAANGGHLYADDVSMQTNGTPGSYTNSLCVASVDNDGTTGLYMQVKDYMTSYYQDVGRGDPMVTLAGEHDYVLIDGYGTKEDWAAVGSALEGKIAICSRGVTPFVEKADNAVDAGAIATVIYNNEPGIIGMDLSTYKKKAPCASITQAAGKVFRESAQEVTTDSGMKYYTGKLTISKEIGSSQLNSEFYTMSDFSSWGVPGTLEMKPEITAPGGYIYSVHGTTPVGGGKDQYVSMSGTSMASPQVAGMAALVAQHMEANHLAEKTKLTPRQLIQSLLMSTAEPMVNGDGHSYFPVIQQGAGLANVGNAVNADSYITMDESATKSFADGKVKVELGDDPQRTGQYQFSFNIHNLETTDKEFTLSADFFTQKVFEDYANDKKDENQKAFYMDTKTVSLPVNVTWEVDGKTLAPSKLSMDMDFDGNGTVNANDGQVLLDYVVDNNKTIKNLEKADIDKDGDVDTYDAYLFFKDLTTSSIAVPGDGSAQVHVTVELTDAWKEHLKTATDGAYVEGYVFAQSMTSKEGVKGTTHSIPVLGFYGSWTDPSMFEAGTLSQYRTGEDCRTPYLGNIEANTYLVTYANDPKNVYPMGGNPMIPDKKYMPERNAINSLNGDTVGKMQFAVIRNAAAGRFTAQNITKGKELASTKLDMVGAAFFYPAANKWQETGYTLKTNFKPKGADEGDKLLLDLTLAPEYYTNAQGEVRWDELGHGASFNLPLVVDNTAPVIKDVSHSFTGNKLVVTASDNQYIAAVVLYNKTGTKVCASTGAIQEIEPGAEAKYELDLSNVSGKKFALQVVDYAMNTTTYMLDMEIGEQQPLPQMMAFSMDEKSQYWFAFDKDTAYKPDAAHGLEPYSETQNVFVGATIADHTVFASTKDGKLYAMPEDDLAEENLIVDAGMMFSDMAYNRADKKIYGISDEKLYTIDKLTGKTEEMGTIGLKTNTLACDAEGTFYCNELKTNKIYKFTLTSMNEPQFVAAVEQKADITSDFVQAMEINPNTGTLCWNSFYTERNSEGYTVGRSYYVEMDPKTGTSKVYNDLREEISCLVIPERAAGDDELKPTDEVSGVIMSKDTLSMLNGTTKKLSALVQPWTATDRSVTWSSENDEIARVDQNGIVTAVGIGTTTVTATSVLNPKMTAKCTVTVEKVDVTLKGVLQDKDGKSKLFSWNMAEKDIWTPGAEIDTTVNSAAYDPKNQTYYVQDNTKGLLMHKFGQDGTALETSETNGAGIPLWDMAYSSYFSTDETPKVFSVYAYYFLPPKDPMHLDNKALNLYGAIEYLTAITSMGYEQYTVPNTGEKLDTEHLVLLDNKGMVYHFYTYWNGEDYRARLAQYPSDLGLSFDGFDNKEKMFCSMVADPNGVLYLSYFNGDSSELYRLALDDNNEMYHAERIGTFGDEVWPAMLTEVTNNHPNPETARRVFHADQEIEAEEVTAEQMKAAMEELRNDTSDKIFQMTEEARQSREEMQPASKVEAEEKTVTVTITAKDAAGADVASTNGLIRAAYDASKLELVELTVHGAYTSKVQEAGKVTFGYVSLSEIPAGDAVATLKFKALTEEASNLTVETLQVNRTAGGKEELKIEFTHENTEVRNAVEATCTKDGYTGDTYCLDCGKLIAKGEVIPAKGHQWSEWTVTKEATCFADGEKTRTCSVCGETETEVIPADTDHCPCKGFEDLDCTKWYHEGVDFVLENGIMEGVGDHLFNPNGKITRGQMVTMLYRMAGNPEVTGENPFTDVQEDKWYTDAVVWAAEVGVTDGVTETTFAPGHVMTREQMVTFLYRYAELNGKDVNAAGDLSKFDDAQNVHDFAKIPMAWAVAEELIEGMDNRLYPANTATRAQGATVLMRYSK